MLIVLDLSFQSGRDNLTYTMFKVLSFNNLHLMDELSESNKRSTQPCFVFFF